MTTGGDIVEWVFKPGDMFYYEPHDALGLIVGESPSVDPEVVMWKYALRSPVGRVGGDHKTSITTANEEMFREGVSSGRLKYFPKR